MVEAISEKSGVLWLSKDSKDIPIPDSGHLYKLGIKKLSIKPFIFVLPVDESLIQKITKEVINFSYSSEKESEEKIQKLLNSLKEKEEKNNELLKFEKNDTKEKLIDELNDSSRMELIDSLATVSQDDLSGYLMTDQLFSIFNRAILFGGKMKIVDASKKGNVLYMRIHTSISTDKAKNNRWILDEELIFVGTSNAGLLIRIGIPSPDLRSPAYAWSQAWLASLHIPID